MQGLLVLVENLPVRRLLSSLESVTVWEMKFFELPMPC
jgi:hypothetical protein